MDNSEIAEADNIATESANIVKAQADASIADAQIAKANADSSKANARQAKASADAATRSAQAAQQNADNSTESMQMAKANADAAASDARLSKINANTAVTDAQIAETNADTTSKNAEASQTSADAAAISAINANSNSELALARAKDTETALAKTEEASKKAQVEAQHASDAHNMSTTVGLAGAFNKQALSARISLVIWCILLAATLALIVAIGHSKIDKVLELTHLLIGKNELLAAIEIEIIFLLSNIAPPTWFAWLATKNISKYFYLSEDYSYKATISQAYLGFKEQASGLDPIFQERLFAAAITQLDANPLRFFESSAHPGSPLQDLLQQPFMQTMLEEPKFKENLTGWFKKVFKTNFYSSKS